MDHIQGFLILFFYLYAKFSGKEGKTNFKNALPIQNLFSVSQISLVIEKPKWIVIGDAAVHVQVIEVRRENPRTIAIGRQLLVDSMRLKHERNRHGYAHGVGHDHVGRVLVGEDLVLIGGRVGADQIQLLVLGWILGAHLCQLGECDKCAAGGCCQLGLHPAADMLALEDSQLLGQILSKRLHPAAVGNSRV